MKVYELSRLSRRSGVELDNYGLFSEEHYARALKDLKELYPNDFIHVHPIEMNILHISTTDTWFHKYYEEEQEG